MESCGKPHTSNQDETFIKGDNPEIFENNILEGKSEKSPDNEIKICIANGQKTGLFVEAQVCDKNLKMLVDSGADTTILSSKFVNTLDNGKLPNIHPSPIKLVSATGEPIPLNWECNISLKLGKLDISHKVLIADIEYDGIMGLDFMTQNSCDILVQNMCLRIKGEILPCFRLQSAVSNSCGRVALLGDVNVPPNSEAIVSGRIIDPLSLTGIDSGWIVEPSPDFTTKYGLFVARSLVNPVFNIPLRVYNPSDSDLTLHRKPT